MNTLFVSQYVDKPELSLIDSLFPRMVKYGLEKMDADGLDRQDYNEPIMIIGEKGKGPFRLKPYYFGGSWPSLEWSFEIAFVPKVKE